MASSALTSGRSFRSPHQERSLLLPLDPVCRSSLLYIGVIKSVTDNRDALRTRAKLCTRDDLRTRVDVFNDSAIVHLQQTGREKQQHRRVSNKTRQHTEKQAQKTLVAGILITLLDLYVSSHTHCQE